MRPAWWAGRRVPHSLSRKGPFEGPSIPSTGLLLNLPAAVGVRTQTIHPQRIRDGPRAGAHRSTEQVSHRRDHVLGLQRPPGRIVS